MKDNDIINFSYPGQYLPDVYQSKHHPKIRVKDIHSRLQQVIDHQTDFSNPWEDIWPVIFDSMNELIFIIDGPGNILWANQAIERWKMTDPNQVKGKNIHELLHPRCFDFGCRLKYFCRDWKKTFPTGEYEVYEREVPIREHFMQIRIQPFPVQKESDNWMKSLAVVIIYDITEHKILENQLQQTSSELKTLFKVFPDLFLLLNAEGIILDQQGGDASDFCITLKDLKGKNIQNIFPKSIAKQFQEAITRIPESSEIVTIEYFLPSPAGEQIFEAKFLSKLKNHIMIIIRNITEKLRLESIAGVMENINNVGYIFTGVRHEICNPMNSIKMILSILQDNLASFSREKVLHYIERALSDTERIEYLLRLLKNFNIYEKLKIEHVSIARFIETFLSLVEEDFLRRGIEIKTVIQPNSGKAWIDSRALQQVMLNIMSNAADALEGKPGAVIIIRVYKKDSNLYIVIKDNGTGILEGVQRKIFKPFFTSKKKGTGLGLVIAKKLLLMMNSFIRIKSLKNIGTTVTIGIPAAPIEKK